MLKRSHLLCAWIVLLVVGDAKGAYNDINRNSPLSNLINAVSQNQIRYGFTRAKDMTPNERLGIKTKLYDWTDYANQWIQSPKAKNLVCSHPPDEVKVWETFIYDCCTNLEIPVPKLVEKIGDQVWHHDVVHNKTDIDVLFHGEQDNNGTLPDIIRISQQREREVTYTWSVTKGVRTHFHGELHLGIPDIGFGGDVFHDIDMETDEEKGSTERIIRTFRVDEEIQIPPGRRAEVDWHTTDQRLMMKWYADVYLKGYVGVYWNSGNIFYPYQPICGHYLWGWQVGFMQDEDTWHKDGEDIRFRIDGVFEGAHSYGSTFIHRECDINKPEDCKKPKSIVRIYNTGPGILHPFN